MKDAERWVFNFLTLQAQSADMDDFAILMSVNRICVTNFQNLVQRMTGINGLIGA
jgi:hypothetical protein